MLAYLAVGPASPLKLDIRDTPRYPIRSLQSWRPWQIEGTFPLKQGFGFSLRQQVTASVRIAFVLYFQPKWVATNT